MTGTRRPGRRAVSLAAAAAALALTLPFAPAVADDDDSNALRAVLTGAKEVPGPADPDGRGRADITIAGTRVCFDLRWARIGAPFAAHIHRGARDVAGPIEVTLFTSTVPLPDTISAVRGCGTAESLAEAREIRRHPGRFYVNVHNTEFPAGAIRGQLFRPEDD